MKLITQPRLRRKKLVILRSVCLYGMNKGIAACDSLTLLLMSLPVWPIYVTGEPDIEEQACKDKPWRN